MVIKHIGITGGLGSKVKTKIRPSDLTEAARITAEVTGGQAKDVPLTQRTAELAAVIAHGHGTETK